MRIKKQKRAAVFASEITNFLRKKVASSATPKLATTVQMSRKYVLAQVKIIISVVMIASLFGCSPKVTVITYKGTSATPYSAPVGYSMKPRSIIQKKDTSFIYHDDFTKCNNKDSVKFDTIVKEKGRYFMIQKNKKNLVRTSFDKFYKDTLCYTLKNGALLIGIPDSILHLNHKRVMKYNVYEVPSKYETEIFFSDRINKFVISNGQIYLQPSLGLIKAVFPYADFDAITSVSIIDIDKVKVYRRKFR
jgi:hypothetical protein